MSWRIDHLKIYLESRIDAVDRRHQELAAERQRAIEAAIAAANEKDKAHNGVLGAMKDQQAEFVTKEQAAMQFKGLAVALGAIAAIVTVIGAVIVLSGGTSG